MKSEDWVREWEKAMGFISKEKRIKDNQRWITYWNYVAEEDTETTEMSVAEKICDFLVSEAYLNKETTILDIGAGNGNYALALAKRGKTVTALDMSTDMLSIITKKIEDKKTKNINTCLDMWETYKNKKKFDLVFASMCPGICDPEALDKMGQMAKKHGVLITVGKDSRSYITTELFKRIAKEPLSGQSPEVIFPFNYLYTQGKNPNLKFYPIAIRPKLTVDKGVQTLGVYFEIFGFKKEKTEKIIRDYLEEIAVDGFFMNEAEINLAVLYWKA